MRMRNFCAVCVVVALVVVVVGSGCSTLDRAYTHEVQWTNAPVVRVSTNELIESVMVPVVTERTNVVYVTNAAGVVSGYLTREPIATNWIAATITNMVPVFVTNWVPKAVTNLVAKPEAIAVIDAAGSIVNMFAPGIGSIVALALGGLYHGYRQARNRKVNEALVQGVETARAVLTTTPQGQAADAQLVRWLMEHQKGAGVFRVISELVDQVSDNPAARMTAMEIADRLHRAEQAKAAQSEGATVLGPACVGGKCG